MVSLLLESRGELFHALTYASIGCPGSVYLCDAALRLGLLIDVYVNCVRLKTNGALWTLLWGAGKGILTEVGS
jgi:hypothetical protein